MDSISQRDTQRMELRHLRHFVALAEERSFTKAAARELIVQSGLSTSIRALEKEVGALLFVRGTRPVRLTAEGTALLPAARHTLDAAEAAQQAVQDAHGVLAGRLRIGALQTSGHSLPFSTWLAEFALAHPGVDISVQQLPALQMLDLVADGRLDCALVSVVEDHARGLEVIPLLAEPVRLVVSRDHPLASAESVTLRELAGERFVDPPAQWAIRVVVDDAFRAAGLTRRIACEVNEWTMVLELVAAGVGVTLAPTGFVLAPRVAAAVRLVGLTGVELVRRIDLVLPQGHAASPAARRFSEYVTAWAAGR
ncbi:DNA-binding transcriptional LysR family regulator [Kribbella orskensis]|uniref:DNA-binding transcriptional LysR family regulator n=2 Tax=Kribbellaceae TaxID=2726069 RepID=A0ABY2BQ65_9ACTN|nr:DNA-binding transcriptional LysR family regulator [Kribbella sp. VKM Ac-2500]TCO27739.1 DNA-binding transcriptional LysR family regulator [Kribbella orskensis]